MSDISNLLQDIYDILKSWFTSFGAFVVDLMTKLNLIETETANLPAIKADCDDIKDNTGAVVTPVLNMKTNTDSIKTDTTTIKNTVGTMSNQLTTISTNVGTASAYAEDCANNTLDCSNRLVTIGSDTTDIRTNTGTITSDLTDIKNLLQYYFITNIVTEDSEGAICNFDTDLEDYLQKAVVTIPADVGGISSVTITKNGKNILDFADISGAYWASPNASLLTFFNSLPGGTYTISYKYKITSLNDTDGQYGIFVANSNNSANLVLRENKYNVNANEEYLYTKTFTILDSDAGNFTNAWFYCGRSGNVDTVSFYDFMNVLGSSATTYEPYKSVVDTVSLGSSITDGGELDLLTGLLKINTTPATYSQLTPIAVRTYKGVNNIYSDYGTMSVTYRETLKHYLDKQQ